MPLSLSSTSWDGARFEGARLRRRANALSRSLARSLLVTKVLPTAGGYAFGDCLTQQLGPVWPVDEWPSKHNPAAHDLTKTALMGGVGAAIGAPLSLALYAAMNAAAPGSSAGLNAAKWVLDQAVGCVLWQAAYMAVSEPYRRTLLAHVATQRQQQRCATGAAAAAPAHARAAAAAPVQAAC